MSSRGLNVFGHHANFGLYLFAPFYWLGLGGPILLNSAMIVSLALAAVPVYLIARDRTGSAAVATTTPSTRCSTVRSKADVFATWTSSRTSS